MAALATRLARLPLPLFVIVAAAFVASAIFARGVHSFSVMPDELGYVKQSLTIARTGFLVGPHGFYFNSWGQLLPLISAPVFGLLSMAHAYYVAHTLYALLLASTAIPAYLLARVLHLGKLAGYLVAAMSVALPQLVLAGEVMTEVVAYPVFVWAILAMVRALAEPGPRRDAVAVAAIVLAFFARTQFVVLAPVLVAAAVIHGLSLSRDWRALLSSHRVLWIATLLGGLAVAALEINGSAHSLFGAYVGPLSGSVLPKGMFGAGLDQLDSVTLAIGVVPVTLAASWALATVLRPRDPARHAFAVVLVLVVPVLFVVVGSFQVRFIAPGGTTDRYLFYLGPLLYTGAAAWIVDRRGSLPGVVVLGGLVAWMLLSKPLHPGVGSMVNPSFTFDDVLHGERGLVALLASAFVALAVLLRRRLRAWQALLAVGLPVLAYAAANTGYTMSRLHSEMLALPASHPSSMGWVDRAVPSGAAVGDVLGYTTAPLPVNEAMWWDVSFWNKTVLRTFDLLPETESFAQSYVGTIRTDLVHGRLIGVAGLDYLVRLDDDYRFAFSGRPIATADVDGGRLGLYKLAPGAPLLYASSGVYERGLIGPHPFIRFFSHDRSSSTTERVVLTLQMKHPAPGCPCTLGLGSSYGQVRLPRATSKALPLVRIARPLTIPAGGYAQLDLAVHGRGVNSAAPPIQLVSLDVLRHGS
jgi:hypothetical protein